MCYDSASAGCLVRSFKGKALHSTFYIQALCADEILRVASARRAVGTGMMRERSGLAEVSAANIAADAMRLLKSRKALAGLPANAAMLVVILDPVTGCLPHQP